jgi:2-oxoglutarate ferredoxin oxidoreductase subunit alpha
VDENIASAKLGFEYIKEHYPDIQDTFLASTTKTTEQYILNASEAVGLGAIEAGMKFSAIYPMTPINSLIQLFADRAKEFGIVYKQPEDEIAGIMMAIGASIGGVRSMVASSGGGFALMVEGVSFAGIIEAPVVIDLGMRPGPATGMPTWTEQAELWMAIHAGHGEFPKIVLAAGDAAESYEQTIEAFELADEFQTPVIILTDKYINESQWCVPKSVFDKRAPMNRGKLLVGKDIPDAAAFKRYDWSSEDGTSPRSVPGMLNGQHLVNSYEHDQKGWTIEDSETRIKMAEKRFRKAKAIVAKMPLPKVYGDADADITFVAWGSTRGSILEAMKLLKKKNVTSKLIHFRWVYPLNESVIAPLLSNEKRLIDVENNGTAQLAEVIREETGVTIKEKLLKFDGRQWYPEEIVEKVIGNA